MTLALATANLFHFRSEPATSGRFLRHLLRVEAWLDARASRRDLYRMDDRALADIGLTNADLGRADLVSSWQYMLLPVAKG
jgi:uncharacterized protein YjiS (DUF1127 family)